MYFKYASIFYYANEAISIIHWSKIKDIGKGNYSICTSTVISPPFYILSNFFIAECPIVYNYTMPCLLNGTAVLSEYGYNERNFWWDMSGLLLLTVFMNIAGYLGTRKRRTLKSMI